MTEFLVLTSHHSKQPTREKVIMQAVIEAAEAAGVEKIIKKRGNVYCTGIYINYGNIKSLLYNDWEKKYSEKRIYDILMNSIRLSPGLVKRNKVVLALA